MKYADFKDDVFRHAGAANLDAFELYGVDGTSVQITVSKGEIDRYQDATSGGAGLKVLKDGRAGLAFTEVYDEESAARLVVEAVSNLSVVDAESRDSIYEKRDEYASVPQYDDAFETVAPEEKIEWALALERAALERDERVSMVPSATIVTFAGSARMANSAGLDLSFRRGGGYAYGVALAESGGDRRTGTEFAVGLSPGDIDLAELGRTAADKALAMLGASSVSSGKYRVVLQPSQTAAILHVLVDMVSAQNVHQGLSGLAGRLGSRFAADKLTIVDDPVVPGSLFNMPFDAQGVATRRKEIVSAGTLITFLHSLKTAAKDGVEPTGNAFRSGYRGGETIQPVNLVLEAGSLDYDGIVSALGNGIVVNRLSGLHAGADPASGEFSLSATGFLVEGGAVSRPVDQITISGNFVDLFGAIEEVGNDVELSPVFPFGMFAPSILVGELDVAGG